MGESTKAVSSLILIVASIATVFAWMADRPDTLTWAFRVGAPTLATLSLALILKLHFRADIAHDYLRSHAGNYFNRDGFCFGINVTNRDGYAFMDAYFQNQRDTPCVGRIAIRPARGFWMTRPKFDAITYEINCEPAAFGVAQVPVPIPEEQQGKRQSFEVGASVTYPNGKGKRLRFFDGVFIRTNTKFDSKLRTAATVIGAAGGSIILSKPATLTVDIPCDVSDTVPETLTAQVTTLWKLGDPPLDIVA